MSSGPHIRLRRNLCIVYCGIIWIVYVPLCLYGLFLYLKHRNHIILKKRHPAFNIYVLLSLLLSFSTFVPLVIICYGLSETLVKFAGNLASWDAYGIYTAYPVLMLLLHCMFSFIWRLFLYHSDVVFYADLGNARWTQLIYFYKYDRDHIKLRHVYSTTSGVQMTIVLFAAICASLIVWPILFASSNEDDDDWMLRVGVAATVLFWSTVCVLIAVYLLYRTPRFKDHLYIRKELTQSVTVIAMTCVLIVADLVVDFVLIAQDSKLHAIVVLSNYFLIASMLCGLFLISTIAVVLANKNALNETVRSSPTSAAMEQDVRNSIELCEMSPKSDTQQGPENEDVSVWSELGNESAFNGLVHHLRREFSIEILTSLIEFTQFQKMVSEMRTDLQTNFDFFVYPSSLVPQSSMVYGELHSDEAALAQHLVDCTMEEGKQDESNDEDSLFVLTAMHRKNDKDSSHTASVKRIEALIRSHTLFQKYVVGNGSLQINLSAEERQRLANLMQEYNEWVNARDNDGQQLKMLVSLFDGCIQEQLCLLNEALSRFKALDVQKL